MERAKILFLDIEATNLCAEMGYILSIGYEWAHENKTTVLRIDDTKEYKKKKTDDRGLLKAFEPVYNEADLIVHHFGDFYDIPYIQTRRLINRMKLLPKVATRDTWRIMKKNLKFRNNRLATGIDALSCPYRKTPVAGPKWVDAMSGITSALNYVVKHNYYDVKALKWYYNKIAPIDSTHPRIVERTNLKKDRYCKVCGSSKVKSLGRRICATHWYRRLVCKNCGHTMKGEKV